MKLADPGEVRGQLVGKHVCPFCGVLRADPAQPCPRCTLDDNNATRTATKQRIGPWFVLQARNPSAPGMKFGTLQSLARRGHISPRSVVRGPTTEQMWAFVATVRGLSREFGLCFHCGEGIETTAVQCPHCGRSQDAPADSDALMETPGQTPLPTPLAPPTPPHDLFSSMSAKVSDTGMDGGTSLDLQADSMAFTPMPLEKRVELPARIPVARPTPIVQRAPTPVKEESILTARELAAAFQLDFRPPGGRNGGKTRRPVRTLAGLVLIAAVAGGIVLGLRADWREKTFTWVSERWGSLTASLEQPAKQAGTGKTVAPKPDPGTPSMSREPARTPVTPINPPPLQPIVETPPPVKPAPRIEPRPEPKVQAPAPVVVTAPPPPKPASVYVPPPAPPAANTPINDLTIEQATVRASDLRLKAIDAQTKNDWATALHLYEQIQRLPRDAWPADLTLRLDVARRKMNVP